jgi:menaquinone-specific isochorismate synthase
MTLGLPVAREPAIHDELGAALARIGDGLCAIAIPAPIGAAAGLLAIDDTGVYWGARDSDEVVVGLGAALELRGSGASRFSDLVNATVGVNVIDRASPPRLFGGAAFTPGAASHAGWSTFGDAWFVLPRLTYRRTADTAWFTLVVDRAAAADRARWHTLVSRAVAALRAPPPRPSRAAVVADAAGYPRWIAGVEAARAAIHRGALEKVVLARPIVARGALSAAAIVGALDARHPECTRFAIRPAAGGPIFVGATPERLIQKDGRAIASEALAGSIARGDDPAGEAARLLASGKDRREHAIVVDAIAATLGVRCSTLSVPATPAVRTLRHVHHLRTTIAGTLRDRTHVLALAAALHPTPAVGGWPTAAAIAHLSAGEPAPRGWYGAPVGWFDGAGDGELAVAIRSALIDPAHERAEVWVGAGIVADSDPDAEWQELATKQRALLGALGAEAA